MRTLANGVARVYTGRDKRAILVRLIDGTDADDLAAWVGRAGVRRVEVWRHFPDRSELFLVHDAGSLEPAARRGMVRAYR